MLTPPCSFVTRPSSVPDSVTAFKKRGFHTRSRPNLDKCFHLRFNFEEDLSYSPSFSYPCEYIFCSGHTIPQLVVPISQEVKYPGIYAQEQTEFFKLSSHPIFSAHCLLTPIFRLRGNLPFIGPLFNLPSCMLWTVSNYFHLNLPR